MFFENFSFFFIFIEWLKPFIAIVLCYILIRRLVPAFSSRQNDREEELEKQTELLEEIKELLKSQRQP